jgi:hypothetical protein
MGLDLSILAFQAGGTLASLSAAGAIVTVGLFFGACVLACRCGGRCKEDFFFRSHVM